MKLLLMAAVTILTNVFMDTVSVKVFLNGALHAWEMQAGPTCLIYAKVKFITLIIQSLLKDLSRTTLKL